jgi:hypothetical protein
MTMLRAAHCCVNVFLTVVNSDASLMTFGVEFECECMQECESVWMCEGW